MWSVTVTSPCNPLHEGLSQLLKAVRHGGPEGGEVLRCYLEESSECREILRYLQWERQRQSSDGVCCMHWEGLHLSMHTDPPYLVHSLYMSTGTGYESINITGHMS